LGFQFLRPKGSMASDLQVAGAGKKLKKRPPDGFGVPFRTPVRTV
jgi:hypothetical protein